MSTELQLKGDSLRRQTELSERYVAEHDLELVSDYELHDIGVSAYGGSNVSKGALGRFLEAIKNGEIPRDSYLLVESLDRLSRQNIDEAVALFFQITKNGVNIVTLADNQVYRAGKTEFAQLIYSIAIMARANEESAMKSSRIAAAWNAKREKINTKVLTKWAPAWLEINADRSGFDIVPDRVKVVKRIFDAASDGQGSSVITRILNTDRVPAFGKSNGWLESYVTKILKNRSVLGEFQPHTRLKRKRVPTGHVFKDYYPRIIDEDLFLKVQAGRRERAIVGGGRRGPKQRNLFTHLVKCDYCGSSMRFIDKGNGPKGGKYLRCGASVRGMNCVKTAWQYGKFETSVFSFVREFDLKAVVEDNHQRSETATLREQLTIKQELLNTKKTERNQVFRLLIGKSTAAEKYLNDQLDAISGDIERIEADLSSIEVSLKNMQSRPVARIEIEHQLSALRQFTDTDNFQDRLTVSTKLRELIKRIVVATDGAKPKFKAIEKFVSQNVQDARELAQLRQTLHESHFSGPRSNPYFTILFHNGTSRVVIPEPTDPTELIFQVDHSNKRTTLMDASGPVMMPFAPNLTEEDWGE